MPRKKLSALAASFQGRWRITEMDICDAEALDLVEPAYLVIDGGEGDQCSGRGRVAMGTAGRLVGHLYFHMGDDSAFVCEPG